MNAPTLMGEGNTPIVRSRQIGPQQGFTDLYFKLENCNPSGSYKDRFVAAQLNALADSGVELCVATSSGNTGSALGAGCARLGMRCFIFVNDRTPLAKLTQMRAHGAVVIRVPDFGSEPHVTASVFDQLQGYAERYQVPLVVSAFRYCPLGMRGVEAISHELVASNANCRPIEHVFVPVGSGGLYSAVVQGFQTVGVVPRVHAVQPAGCSTVCHAYRTAAERIPTVISTTGISGLSVPSDIDASLALKRLRECEGVAFEVDDVEILTSQRMLLEREGIFCEPAGAAALAGWQKAVAAGLLTKHAPSVCLVTGSGFKDGESIETVGERHTTRVLSQSDLHRFPEVLSELLETQRLDTA